MRQQVAQRLFELEGAPPAQDEGDDLPEERAVRAERLRVAVDVLTTVLSD